MEKLLKRVEKLDEECALLKTENSDLKQRIAQLEELQSKSNEALTDAVKDTFSREGASYVEKLKKNLKSSQGEVVTITEVADMQDRRYNHICRGIEELPNPSPTERKNHDEEEVLKVVERTGLCTKNFRESLVHSRRFGRREEGASKTGYSRPICVRLSCQELREKALRRNRELRAFNAENSTKYRIDADLTKAQKDNLDMVWALARQKSRDYAKNGVTFFVIGQENPQIRSSKVEDNKPKRLIPQDV